MAEKSITIRSKEQKNQIRADDWEEPRPSAKKRHLQDDNDLDTETHISWGQDIEEVEPMEEGSGNRGIERADQSGFAFGRDCGSRGGLCYFQDLPKDVGWFVNLGLTAL